MNRSVLAAAVAASMFATTLAHADANLYGSLRVQVQHASPDEGSSTTGVTDGGSRFGIRASEDLGNDLTAFGHLEFRANTASFNDGFAEESANNINGRLAYAGLRGAFGSLSAGTQWGTYTSFGFSAVDQFINPSLSAHTFASYRDTHSIQYVSPDMGPVSMGAQIRMEGGEETKSVDDITVGARVALGVATLQGAYFRDQNEGDRNIYVAASVEAAPGFTLAAGYEDYETLGGGDNINAYAGYAVGSSLIHVAWGRNSPKEGSSENEYILGFVHNLSARTSVYLEHWDDLNSDKNTVVGFRHNF